MMGVLRTSGLQGLSIALAHLPALDSVIAQECVGPRAVVVEELTQLRRASQSKRTGADNNRASDAGTAQQ